MSDKQRPKWTSKVTPEPSPVDGVDTLPLPMGINMKAVRDAEQRSEGTPGAMGNKGNENNGDNPSISDSINFANGKDVRSYDGGGAKSAPAPGKVGA